MWGYAFNYLEGNELVNNETYIEERWKWDDRDLAYSSYVIQMWTNFIKFGYFVKLIEFSFVLD